ncbi:hypothetical protein AVEN_247109-1 [Araneus ventricosus]|uniref:RNase H type-1 domain-containing protein n=1 Tax=Araneus ventricosus TaxID=182803 RepID=A0A4Y2QZD6_ARAVE|nr:hypothetical protein AVEN_247109-1 [Araneus ventricosus]
MRLWSRNRSDTRRKGTTKRNKNKGMDAHPFSSEKMKVVGGKRKERKRKEGKTAGGGKHKLQIKTHVGYRVNEEADTLAKKKKTITEIDVMKALNPRSELKQHLQELFLKKWQNLWDNGNTGRSVHKVLKTVHLKPVFWTREEILFVTGHGPFPSFLNRFHLSDSA